MEATKYRRLLREGDPTFDKDFGGVIGMKRFLKKIKTISDLEERKKELKRAWKIHDTWHPRRLTVSPPSEVKPSESSGLYEYECLLEELKICFRQLEKKLSKSDIVGEIGGVVGNLGNSLGTLTLGIPKVTAEIIKASANFSKIKLVKKGNDQFQIFLTDENELLELEDAYKWLTNIIKKYPDLKDFTDINTHKIFENDYQIFNVLAEEGIWEGRSLNIERMEKVIISLNKNLKLLEKELKQQAGQLLSNIKHKLKLPLNNHC